MKLENVATEQLEKELKKRKDDANKKPVMRDNGSNKQLQNLLNTHIENIAGNCVDEDEEHYIYEAVMELYFGTDIWEWVNGRHE